MWDLNPRCCSEQTVVEHENSCCNPTSGAKLQTVAHREFSAAGLNHATHRLLGGAKTQITYGAEPSPLKRARRRW